jgi:hypothetical protein
MVMPWLRRPSARQGGALSADLMAAMAVLLLVALPLAFAFEQETRLCRACYHRAVALEIVDGEMELLVAGGWRAFPQGARPYPIEAGAARNLPPGRFVLTVRDRALRLEWLPQKRRTGGPVVREVRLP